jgi:hypothetical protein
LYIIDFDIPIKSGNSKLLNNSALWYFIILLYCFGKAKTRVNNQVVDT